MEGIQEEEGQGGAGQVKQKIDGVVTQPENVSKDLLAGELYHELELEPLHHLEQAGDAQGKHNRQPVAGAGEQKRKKQGAEQYIENAAYLVVNEQFVLTTVAFGVQRCNEHQYHQDYFVSPVAVPRQKRCYLRWNQQYVPHRYCE